MDVKKASLGLRRVWVDGLDMNGGNVSFVASEPTVAIVDTSDSAPFDWAFEVERLQVEATRRSWRSSGARRIVWWRILKWRGWRGREG